MYTAYHTTHYTKLINVDIKGAYPKMFGTIVLLSRELKVSFKNLFVQTDR